MKAAIDVGSNTVRMVVGEAAATQVLPLRYWRKITRLGGGYRPETGISPDAAERTILALQEFTQDLAAFPQIVLRAVGTEAIRRSRNASAFVAAVQDRCGLALEVIDGEEEARLSACGVCSALDPLPRTALIFDIGGGSTEFILRHRFETVFHQSYPLGVVTLAEHGTAAETICTLLARVANDLEEQGWREIVGAKECELVGTAGTVTTLAALAMEMETYDWRRINNFRLARQQVEELVRRLAPLSPAEREMVAGMEPGRGDLIVPGMEIVMQILTRFDKQSMRVSDFGLLEGVLLSMERN